MIGSIPLLFFFFQKLWIEYFVSFVQKQPSRGILEKHVQHLLSKALNASCERVHFSVKLHVGEASNVAKD